MMLIWQLRYMYEPFFEAMVPLPFQVHGVHKTLRHLLGVYEHAALKEELVCQGRFTVIYVGNNGHISDLILIHNLVLCYLPEIK